MTLEMFFIVNSENSFVCCMLGIHKLTTNQLTFTFLKSTIETLEKDVKYPVFIVKFEHI